MDMRAPTEASPSKSLSRSVKREEQNSDDKWFTMHQSLGKPPERVRLRGTPRIDGYKMATGQVSGGLADCRL